MTLAGPKRVLHTIPSGSAKAQGNVSYGRTPRSDQRLTRQHLDRPRAALRVGVQ